jgi:cell division protein FtsB
LKQSAAKPEGSIRNRLLASGYRNRRRLATGAAMMLAALMGYFAVIGDNGLTVYKQKRIETRQLAKQIDALKAENERLQAHVERLKSDPDAIEHEAREKLHYTRAGEVIYTLPDSPGSNHGTTPASSAATPSQ